MTLKTENRSATTRLGKAALLTACALLVASFTASAATPTAGTIGVDLGPVGIQTSTTIPPAQFNNLAVFTLGTSGEPLEMENSAQIIGDVAVAGNGKLSLCDTAKIIGRLSYFKPGSLSKSSGATITGPIYNDTATNSLLTAGVTAANNASNLAKTFANQNRSMSLTKIENQNLTLSVGAGLTSVYNLTDLKLNKNFTLTLQGTATSAYVFNVSKTFSLADNAKIQLTGGLTWNDVLFNVTGSNTVAFKGNTVMSGIILAKNSAVELENAAQINGAVIAKAVELEDTAKITRPPIVSP